MIRTEADGCAYPELRLINEAPPLLHDIGQVYVASRSSSKIDAVRNLLHDYPILKGETFIEPKPKDIPGEEPAWENAILVSRHKVESLVEHIRGDFGCDTLVIGSDIVVWINGIPYTNLSRIYPISGEYLEREARKLQQIFSEKTVVMWDISTSASRKQWRVTTGERQVVRFSPLCPKQVYEQFMNDLPGALGRSTRIPLIDNFKGNIESTESIPLIEICDSTGNLCAGHELMRCVEDLSPSQRKLMDINRQVVGGLPTGDSLEIFLNFRPKNKHSGDWYLI